MFHWSRNHCNELHKNFLHTPLYGSNKQRISPRSYEKYTTTGGVGLGSNAHCRVTTSLTSTILDGWTVKVMPTEKKTMFTLKKNNLTRMRCCFHRILYWKIWMRFRFSLIAIWFCASCVPWCEYSARHSGYIHPWSFQSLNRYAYTMYIYKWHGKLKLIKGGIVVNVAILMRVILQRLRELIINLIFQFSVSKTS